MANSKIESLGKVVSKHEKMFESLANERKETYVLFHNLYATINNVCDSYYKFTHDDPVKEYVADALLDDIEKLKSSCKDMEDFVKSLHKKLENLK